MTDYNQIIELLLDAQDSKRGSWGKLYDVAHQAIAGLIMALVEKQATTVFYQAQQGRINPPVWHLQGTSEKWSWCVMAIQELNIDPDLYRQLKERVEAYK